MSLFKLLVIIFLLLNITSCEKDDLTGDENTKCTDKQYPGEYFPAYPKSWWNYSNFNNETVKYEISSEYQNCEGKCRPVFKNINKCIQGNSLIQRFYTGLGTSSIIDSPIYSTTKDSILICPISFSTFKEQDAFLLPEDIPYRRKTTTIDTTITVNSQNYTNVLIVYEYNKFDSLHRYYDYFAKDVGLIKRDSVNINNANDLIEILRLENYHIEN